jgi:hypothetical protein
MDFGEVVKVAPTSATIKLSDNTTRTFKVSRGYGSINDYSKRVIKL